jgi:hypothetical protein
MSDLNDSASTGGGVPLSATLLDFCAKVRKDDPTVLMYPGEPFRIRVLSEDEHMELADALLENNSITYLELGTAIKHPRRYIEAMAEYVRTSKCLQRICWHSNSIVADRVLQPCEEMLCYLLPAIQEKTSFKELKH